MRGEGSRLRVTNVLTDEPAYKNNQSSINVAVYLKFLKKSRLSSA